VLRQNIFYQVLGQNSFNPLFRQNILDPLFRQNIFDVDEKVSVNCFEIIVLMKCEKKF
jgi:hypothetical protein